MNKKFAKKAVGIRVLEPQIEPSTIYEKEPLPDEAVICRCERVTAGEIRAALRNGVRDMNHLKAITRSGMGSCGSKHLPADDMADFPGGGHRSWPGDGQSRPAFVC